MGQAPGLAAATGAYSCFEDEAGQSLRPPEARTWARRGCTPVAVVSGKGSGRVSAAGLARTPSFKPRSSSATAPENPSRHGAHQGEYTTSIQ